MHRQLLILVLVGAGCSEDPPSSGPGLTTHVITVEFAASTGAACVEATLADVDLTTPGEQFECSVTQLVTATHAETVLPQCNNVTTPTSSSNQPCWYIREDSANCLTDAHLAIAIARPDQPPEALVKAQCVAQD
jgi:hypothetical protein